MSGAPPPPPRAARAARPGPVRQRDIPRRGDLGPQDYVIPHDRDMIGRNLGAIFDKYRPERNDNSRRVK